MLVPSLLRESLALELPEFAVADIVDADFTQTLPAQFRADLVICLRSGPPELSAVMGIVVEVQRARDEGKRRSWPLYVAALHARLQRPTCLVVLTTDRSIAAWAAEPITSLQPGSPFVPLVIGPDEVPRVGAERARQEPWLATLSALAHGNSPGGADVTMAAIDATSLLDIEHAKFCFDIIYASLDDVARRALEAEMQQSGKYEYRSEFARRYIGQGREEGREEGRLDELRRARGALVELASRRLAAVSDEVRRRIDACDDVERLTRSLVEVGAAADAPAVERLLAEL